jgi:NAD(P)-dependent dehydrogenase (short-subunit alcohol dehydrogenase family)
MGKLQDKVVVVTGGNSGIGLASARLFAEEGAQVVITGRRAEAVAEAAAEIGRGAIGFTGDVASLADHDRLVAEVKERFGRIDVYFANAGISEIAPPGAVTEESYDRVFNTNVKGLFFGVQKALPLIPDGGAIIVTGSVVSIKGFDGFAPYSATKAAIRSFVRTWTSELKGRGIRVNVLSPGPIETPIVDKMGLSDEAVREFEQGVVAMVPLGRFGQPEELAKAALFLASDDSSYVNGAELFADGGAGAV